MNSVRLRQLNEGLCCVFVFVCTEEIGGEGGGVRGARYCNLLGKDMCVYGSLRSVSSLRNYCEMLAGLCAVWAVFHPLILDKAYSRACNKDYHKY